MRTIPKSKNGKLEDFIESAIGPFPAPPHDKKEWQNLYDHCLMEAARACVFAEMLHFNKGLKKDLVLAALFHDGNKRLEIAAIREAMQSGASSRAASNAATREYLRALKRKGMSRRIIRFVGLVGGAPDVLYTVKKILGKISLSAEDLAALAMHYIDDYTVGGEWASPATRPLRGALVNDVDRRMEKNKNNPNYKKIEAEDLKELLALRVFPRMSSFASSFEAMAVVSHEIEKRLLSRVKAWEGINPLRIPEIVDKKIREWLAAAA